MSHAYLREAVYCSESGGDDERYTSTCVIGNVSHMIDLQIVSLASECAE